MTSDSSASDAEGTNEAAEWEAAAFASNLSSKGGGADGSGRDMEDNEETRMDPDQGEHSEHGGGVENPNPSADIREMYSDSWPRIFDAAVGSSKAAVASNSCLSGNGCRGDENRKDLDQGKQSEHDGGGENPNPNGDVRTSDKEELSREDDGKQLTFSVSELVWGKVSRHPWRPAQIVHPSFASKPALKRRKKDRFLVAYFGDRTFAWNSESQLQPFESSFSHLLPQCSTDAYLHAIDEALGEMARLTEIGMSCGCTIDMLNADLMQQKLQNPGVRGGTLCPIADRRGILSSFEPGRLVELIQELALFSFGDCNRLELVKAMAQLKPFSRLNSKDRSDFRAGGEESGAKRRGRGRPPAGKKSLPEKRRATDSDSGKAGKLMKKNSIESLGDHLSGSASPSLARAAKFGESMRRVASEIKRSSPVFEAHSSWRDRRGAGVTGDEKQRRRAGRRSRGGFDDSGLVSVEVKTACSPGSLESTGSCRERKMNAKSKSI
ncbi:Serine/threonine-protein kinase ATM [Apostasia shenzhenica]|uniref:Serine/threonine-protein kinase ATM n=1 Tax=Apostasia shenzhenica TaxID=1088818 RepID=A0A2I0BGP0_9ASPA|nr:Serine/threonine-protein kinase ATM [Apostasia shenzhenica]